MTTALDVDALSAAIKARDDSIKAATTSYHDGVSKAESTLVHALEKQQLIYREPKAGRPSTGRLCAIIGCAGLFAMSIAFGWYMWPNLHVGCHKYTCDTVIDWSSSGCWNGSGVESCVYLYYYLVDGHNLEFDWTTDGSRVYESSNSTPPFPNGTTCYQPAGCESPWGGHWYSWDGCQPVFTCTNGGRISGRIAFTATLASVAGILFIGLCCHWLYKNSVVDEAEATTRSAPIAVSPYIGINIQPTYA